jgi:hypothetical protein
VFLDHNLSQSDSPVKPRWSRQEVARLLDLWHNTPDQSLQAFAQAHQVPSRTFAFWIERYQNLPGSAQAKAFFESEAGLAFLHRLQLAAHLCFNQAGNCGIRLLCECFQLCELSPYLACSHGSQWQFAQRLQTAILDYGQQESERLSSCMSHKTITLAEDETFHPQTCLVAIEPVSNFILVEQYEEARDALTWTQVVTTAIAPYDVTVIQVTSDAARGLIAHAQNALGVHHSPDLFHIQQDIWASIGPLLRAEIRQHQSAAEERLQQAQAFREQQEQAQNQRKPGRPFDYQMRIDTCEAFAGSYQRKQADAEGRLEKLKAETKQLRDSYHPFNLQTGAARKEGTADRVLTKCFDRLEQLAEQGKPTEKSRKRLAKARRQLKKMIQTIVWFWAMVRLTLKPLGLNRAQRRAMEQLIASAYLKRVAEQTRDPEQRSELRQRSVLLREQALSRDGPLASIDDSVQAQYQEIAESCAQFFQRSSSCVEGRNGQLALRHHTFHRLSASKLSALTVLHNYWIRRVDGTTAAERFFGQPPADLFAELLSRLPVPSRGAQSRRAA